jgi:preprotein translocase subunit YajC
MDKGLKSMLITPAFAQSSSGGGGADIMGTAFLFIALIAIWYFLIIRPQQAQVKKHKEMLGNLRRGDTIVTNGGLIGKVTKVVDEQEFQVEIADGVRVRIARGAVATLRTKTEPVEEK